MEALHVSVKEVPGTKIHLVKKAESNPAREEKDMALFRNEYWEVHMSSTGEHPDFQKGWWKILLVVLTGQAAVIEVPADSGLWFVPIAPGSRPVSIKTFINSVEVDGVSWQFPSLCITLCDETEVRIPCAKEQMILSHAVN